MTAARSGIEANGIPATDRNIIPYKQDYAYNAFGNVTSRNTYHWTEADNQTNAWTNNKENSWTYDVDGRLKATPENKYYYDASGRTVMVTLNDRRRTIQHLDGEGRAARQDQYNYSNYYHQYNLQQSVYYIYSSVLGKLLTEINSDGTKKRTFVYGTGGVVALQQYSGTNQEVRWEHTDPSNASYVQTGYNGLMYYFDSPAELDPLGSNVGLYNPYSQQQPNSPQNLGAGGGWGYGSWGDPFGGYSCMVDWMPRSCSDAAGILAGGAGVIYNGPQFTHDGNGWGGFECQAGGACGYYFHYDYDLGQPDGTVLVRGGQQIYFHPADVYSGPFFFNLNRNQTTHAEPPLDSGIRNTSSSDPCAGNKGKIDPNQAGYPGEGIDHVSDRHISPQTPGWIGKKSYFEFGLLFTKGQPLYTKDQRKDIVMGMFQEAFEKGAANRLSGGDYAYSYAPYVPLVPGVFKIDFIGRDHRHNDDATNVRTVILDVSDCLHPILSTGYPGLARPTDQVFGVPTWVPRTGTLPF